MPKHGRARVRVGFVAHDAGGPGGMETQIEAVATGLADQGYAVYIYSSTCAFAQRPGVRWVRVVAPRRPLWLRLPLFGFMAWVQLLLHRVDVLFATGAIVPRHAEYAVVHFCHHAHRARCGSRAPARDTAMYWLSARLTQAMVLWTERVLYRPRWTDCLVAVSPDTADELHQFVPHPQPPIVVAENGVDITRFRRDEVQGARVREQLGLTTQDRVLLFVGGDWDRKRLALAIDALSLAPEWTLIVVGAGDRTRYKAQAAALGVSKRIRFVGPVRDPRAFYWACDLLVQPSQYEALPLVLLEACAAGVPIVTTLRTRLAYELEGAGAALMVDADPARLGAAVHSLQEADLQRMGERARAAAIGRAWQHTVARFVELVETASPQERVIPPVVTP